MNAMASQINGPSIVCSIIYSGTDQRKHQNSASLAFLRRIHRWPMNSPHRRPATRKMSSCTNSLLTHLGWVTHICVSKLNIVGSDNGLSPDRRQAIIWTNAGILLIGPLGTNFNEISIDIRIFSFKKRHLKMSSEKWRPFCPGRIVLKQTNCILYVRGSPRQLTCTIFIWCCNKFYNFVCRSVHR